MYNWKVEQEQKPVEINITGPNQVPSAPPVANSKRIAMGFVALALALIFGLGLKWVFSVVPTEAPFLLFSYAVGLTMIFLPCTLPLAFVIVPLSMGKSPKKGILIALSFSLGVTITLAFYGSLIGLLGNALGIGRVETAKNILYAIAGFLGIIFALGELGFINFRMPTYSGGGPGFIQRQQEYLKALLLGLFLGNVGVGCPNPLFNAVIVPQIVVEASVYKGFLIMFIHALGRVTPLLLLAFLAIIGVNATGFLVRHKEKVAKATGWGMVFVGGFLVLIGAFGHDGYVYSGIHSILEKITQEQWITNILGEKIKTLGHTHFLPTSTYSKYAPWTMLALWLIPLWWWYVKRRGEIEENEKRGDFAFPFLFSLSLLLILVFGWALPHQFLYHTGHSSQMEEIGIKTDIMSQSELKAKIPVAFEIDLKDKTGSAPTSDSLQYTHERLFHVIAVDENFETFQHIHPEDQQVLTQDMFKSGKFPFNLTLEKDGRYLIAVDYAHLGHSISFTKIFDIGKRQPVLTKDFSHAKKFGNYQVSFGPNKEKIVSGENINIKYHFEKDGAPLSDLEPYLGAPMHFAIISEGFGGFAHTHGSLTPESEMQMQMHGSLLPRSLLINSVLAHGGPEEDSRKVVGAALPAKFGPDIYLSYIFPYPGVFVIFGEFKHQEKVVTTKFMVEVGQGSGIVIDESMPNMH